MATNVGPTPNSETITLNEPGTDVEKSAQAPTQGPDHKPEVDSSDPYCCQLAPEDDPKHLPSWRKWLAVFAISSSSMCATFASSVVRHIPVYFLLFQSGIDGTRSVRTSYRQRLRRRGSRATCIRCMKSRSSVLVCTCWGSV